MGGKNKKSSSNTDDTKQQEAPFQAVLLADDAFYYEGNKLALESFGPLNLESNNITLNNVILLEYAMEFCAMSGVEECIVVVKHDIQDIFKNNNYNFRVRIIQDTSLTNAGDALRELDKRNWIQSDPFLLLSGNIVANINISRAMKNHVERKRNDSGAIMTLFMKPVGSNMIQNEDDNNDSSFATTSVRSATNDDLVIGLARDNRLVYYDDNPKNQYVNIPCSFFASHPDVTFRDDMFDCKIALCSPEVLARFSDEFDYRYIQSQFVANSVAEEEEGLQNKIYVCELESWEFGGRVEDFTSMAEISLRLLQRWCYPIVPENNGTSNNNNRNHNSFVLQRHYVYRERTKTNHNQVKIGRTSSIGPNSMIGSRCIIGEHCNIINSVLGNDVIVHDNVQITNSFIWNACTIERDVNHCVIANDCKILANVSKCIVGQRCVVNAILPEFTRLTTMTKAQEKRAIVLAAGNDDDDDDFGKDEFDDSEEEEDNNQQATQQEDKLETDHDVVGPGGVGRVWKPMTDDGEDDSDEEEETGGIAPEELFKAHCLGYDVTKIYRARQEYQAAADDDDDFSDDDEDDDDFDNQDIPGVRFVGEMPTTVVNTTATPPMNRKNIIQELKNICLEFEHHSSPVENMAIELNSFKFSQNASYADCIMGILAAVLENMNISADMTNGKLVASFQSQLDPSKYKWKPLIQKMTRGLEEERAVIMALEEAATSEGEMAKKLQTEPSFRFLLQTLHDQELISDESVLGWAAAAKQKQQHDTTSVRAKLFQQTSVQEFLEWIEEEEDDDDDEDEEDDEDEDEDDE